MKINHKHLKPHQEALREYLDKNPKFKALWEENRPQRELNTLIMGERIKRKMTQKQLALKAGLKQPNIARIESGNIGNINTLAKIAAAFDSKLEIKFTPL